MPAVRLEAVSRRKGLPTRPRARGRLRRLLEREVTRDMVVDARSRCPVRTGRLRRSISGEATVRGSVFLRLRATTHYASYVEYGTRYQRAQPYLTPPWKRAVPRFRQVIGKFIREDKG